MYIERTAVYRLDAEQARQMYKSRSNRDKDVPFKKYIIDMINSEYGLKWKVTKLELV